MALRCQLPRIADGDHRLPAAAEEGEDATLQAYSGALEKELPFPICQVLAEQAERIQASHDYVRAAWEDQLATPDPSQE